MPKQRETPVRIESQVDQVTSLRRKKGLVLTKLTKYDTFADNFNIEHCSVKELLSRQATLQQLYNDHETFIGLLTEVLSVEEFQELQTSIDNFEDKFHKVSWKISDLVNMHTNHQIDSKTIKSQDPPEHHSEAKKLGIKLPEFHIKKFDGDKLTWLAFKNVYIAVIHTREDISDVVKFTYLLDSVSGKAYDVIGTINLTSEGYNAAWNNLMKVYDKPKLISQANIIGLFNLPKCREGSATELRQLLNSLTSHLASLNALDIKTDKLAELIIINIIINCLNNYLETEWNKSVGIDEMPRLENMISFLEKECCNLESMIHTQMTTFNINKPRLQSYNKESLRTMVATSDGRKDTGPIRCNVCEQIGHYSFQCEVLLNLPIKERITKVSHLCSNCFGSTHTTDQCRARHGCKLCGAKHNTILH